MTPTTESKEAGPPPGVVAEATSPWAREKSCCYLMTGPDSRGLSSGRSPRPPALNPAYRIRYAAMGVPVRSSPAQRFRRRRRRRPRRRRGPTGRSSWRGGGERCRAPSTPPHLCLPHHRVEVVGEEDLRGRHRPRGQRCGSRTRRGVTLLYPLKARQVNNYGCPGTASQVTPKGIRQYGRVRTGDRRHSVGASKVMDLPGTAFVQSMACRRGNMSMS